MKKTVFFLLLLSVVSCAFAQDVIVRTDGSTILCRVVSVGSDKVYYKKWTNLKGTTYTINSSQVSAINYEKGKKQVLNRQSSNDYAPSLQSDGTWRVNDLALSRMADIESYRHKSKVWSKISTFGGGAIALAGIGTLCGTGFSKDGWKYGGLMALGGAALGVGGHLLSRHYARKADELQSGAMWQHDIKLDNGNSLALGIDVLNDNAMQTKACGVGIRYTF